MTGAPGPAHEALDDAVLAGLVAARDPAAVRLVTTRNNQRLFRVAFAILSNRAEAEDAVQSAYYAPSPRSGVSKAVRRSRPGSPGS